MKDSRLRLDELLVAEATDTLSVAEEKELSRLLAEHSDVDRSSFQRVVAAVFLAAGSALADPLPSGLRTRILENAGRELDTLADDR